MFPLVLPCIIYIIGLFAIIVPITISITIFVGCVDPYMSVKLVLESISPLLWG